MLAVSHRSFEASSTSQAGLAMEDTGTINPAALNAPGKQTNPRLPRSATRPSSCSLRLHNIGAARLNVSPSHFTIADPSCPPLANTISPNLLSTSSPRGQKRSRTPDSYATPGVKTEGGMSSQDTRLTLRMRMWATQMRSHADMYCCLQMTPRPTRYAN